MSPITQNRGSLKQCELSQNDPGESPCGRTFYHSWRVNFSFSFSLRVVRHSVSHPNAHVLWPISRWCLARNPVLRLGVLFSTMGFSMCPTVGSLACLFTMETDSIEDAWTSVQLDIRFDWILLHVSTQWVIRKGSRRSHSNGTAAFTHLAERSVTTHSAVRVTKR